MVQHRGQRQTVAPILVKVAVQQNRVRGVAVHHQLRLQGGALDRAAELHRKAAAVHRKGQGIPCLLGKPAVFPVVEMPKLFPRVGAETVQRGAGFAQCQPLGVFVGVGGQRGGQRRFGFRLVPLGIDICQQLCNLLCHKPWPKSFGCRPSGVSCCIVYCPSFIWR